MSDIITNQEQAVPKIIELLTNAVDKVEGRFGIAFSGGVDSSLLALIASKLGKDFILYNSGLENSQDVRKARELAEIMNWKLKVNELNVEEAEKVIINVHRIIPEKDFVAVGIVCPLYSALESAKKDNIKTVLTGYAADSLFAGFDRFKDLSEEEVLKEIDKSVSHLEEYAKTREGPIGNHFGIKLVFPFRDKEFFDYAMKIAPSLKINNEMNKIVLREAAVKLGLPKEFAYRPKKAAQYGSKFDKTIQKLA
ncbi:MAG: asparagine synthase C-terminal domain-containing protein, partial [Candidatus Nanoarchaeia archaeon]|nr:asparagine synthase C-terminal domain-containing protein [Candidatus Nanoarchaeia archaeon]